MEANDTAIAKAKSPLEYLTEHTESLVLRSSWHGETDGSG